MLKEYVVIVTINIVKCFSIVGMYIFRLFEKNHDLWVR